METKVKAQVQELIQNWIQKFGTDTDAQLAKAAANWAIYGLALQWSRDKNGKRPSVEKFVDQILPLITANLGMP